METTETIEKNYAKVSSTRNLPSPNIYAVALLNENTNFNYDEERAPQFKGAWRDKAFQVAAHAPLDVEIGIGNGYHFAHYVQQNPDRNIVGFELKYKPLIQTARRALATGQENFRVIRYSGNYMEDIFAAGEINNVYIHFPDPWAKARQLKNRLFSAEFLNSVMDLQTPGSFIEFKTDHEEYFLYVTEEVKKTKYSVERYTLDLHQSEWASENFQTHFEKLWTSKGLKSYMMRLRY